MTDTLAFWCPSCKEFRVYGLTTISIELVDMPVTLNNEGWYKLDSNIQDFAEKFQVKKRPVRCDECASDMKIRDRRVSQEGH